MLSKEVLSFLQKEQEDLKHVINSLDAQIDRCNNRHYQENIKSRELTAQLVSARRDIDKQLIAMDEAISYRLRDGSREELQHIVELKNTPYFARVVVKELYDTEGTEEITEKSPGRIIEYRLGKHSNTDCRIVDWKKSPISKLFYEYREGDEYCEIIQGKERFGIILARIKVRINDGQLEAVSCSLGDFAYQNGQWEERTYSPVKRNTRSALPDVTDLITIDQFRAITQEASGAVFIKGVAGSGKTTVALHRLTWLIEKPSAGLIEKPSAGLIEKPSAGLIEKPSRLMYKDLAIAKSSSLGNCERSPCVIVQTKTLKSYIKNTLRSLQHDDIEVLTFEEWIKGEFIREFGNEDKIGNLKIVSNVNQSGYKSMVSSIERFKHSVALLQRIDEYTNEQKDRAVEYLSKYVDTRITKLSSLFVQAKKPHFGSFELIDQIEKLLANLSNELLSDNINKLKGELITLRKKLGLYDDELALILSNTELLLNYDQTKLLDKSVIMEARQKYEANRAKGVVDFTDAALLLLLKQSKKGRSVLHKFGHKCMVIDEVQDFSSLELALVTQNVANTSSLSLVGDIEQATSEDYIFPAWAALKRHWFDTQDVANTVTLNVSQRSSLGIIRFANYIKGVKNASLRNVSSIEDNGKPGKPPLCHISSSEELGVGYAIAWLNKVLDMSPGSLVAVICPSKEDARYAYGLLKPNFTEAIGFMEDTSFCEEGIIVSDVKSVKGLEFSYVLIWNPTKRAYPMTDLARNMLYVAVTRAEELLSIFIWGEPSPLLPPIYSPLWRVRDRKEEEKEEEEQE